ncbi:membrane protease subunit, stomatin/prohibitin [Bernardetia litoralis DSM 6794]|uniref:Membrane protease subunit, stomatin/prohibitin n=1 Tax=Bernardetia litoralis (strain ATCC 23117 / DSM 6794 / NBRC 15988 / NCIMB 1366 / Fx l1 / Sio-4) TaxID=880071 RepID=I4AHE0_BERLS|nr:prohibitin family protein [Bernardetia litoralis]AFM03375.1 membrane protease subunit, stomatin/prohibitin [Bernardetia litoralis DSM 6794]
MNYLKLNSKLILSLLLIIIFSFLLSSCGIVRPGEVGVKQRLGKIKGGVRQAGMYFHNPFFTKIVKVPTRTINMYASLSSLPTKEGLTISCDLSVLFHIEQEYAIKVVQTVGVKNGQDMIMSVLRSSVADVTAQFLAKDLHTSERHEIELAIAKKMTERLGDRGFVVESVLLKSINLPANLSKTIEEKLQAEQRAQTMQFVLEHERQEAERMKIEAEAIRDAQKIINESLSEMTLRYLSIEAFKELSKSNNAKVIITNGKTPFLIHEDGK